MPRSSSSFGANQQRTFSICSSSSGHHVHHSTPLTGTFQPHQRDHARKSGVRCAPYRGRTAPKRNRGLPAEHPEARVFSAGDLSPNPALMVWLVKVLEHGTINPAFTSSSANLPSRRLNQRRSLLFCDQTSSFLQIHGQPRILHWWHVDNLTFRLELAHGKFQTSPLRLTPLCPASPCRKN